MLATLTRPVTTTLVVWLGVRRLRSAARGRPGGRRRPRRRSPGSRSAPSARRPPPRRPTARPRPRRRRSRGVSPSIASRGSSASAAASASAAVGVVDLGGDRRSLGRLGGSLGGIGRRPRPRRRARPRRSASASTTASVDGRLDRSAAVADHGRRVVVDRAALEARRLGHAARPSRRSGSGSSSANRRSKKAAISASKAATRALTRSMRRSTTPACDSSSRSRSDLRPVIAVLGLLADPGDLALRPVADAGDVVVGRPTQLGDLLGRVGVDALGGGLGLGGEALHGLVARRPRRSPASPWSGRRGTCSACADLRAARRGGGRLGRRGLGHLGRLALDGRLDAGIHGRGGASVRRSTSAVLGRFGLVRGGGRVDHGGRVGLLGDGSPAWRSRRPDHCRRSASARSELHGSRKPGRVSVVCHASGVLAGSSWSIVCGRACRGGRPGGPGIRDVEASCQRGSVRCSWLEVPAVCAGGTGGSQVPDRRSSRVAATRRTWPPRPIRDAGGLR